MLVERRRSHAADLSSSLSELRAQLNTRLLSHAQAQAQYAMRHLVFVLRELARAGWTGVGALPKHVQEKALFQAEMLANEEPSPLLKG